MTHPYDSEIDTKPWRESVRDRLRRKIPKLPTSFENRLLLIGTVLIVIDGAHLVLGYAREFLSFILWPFDIAIALLNWIMSL